MVRDIVFMAVIACLAPMQLAAALKKK